MGVCGSSEEAEAKARARAEAEAAAAARTEAVAQSTILLQLETDRATHEPASEVTGYGLETVANLLERVAEQELGLSGITPSGSNSSPGESWRVLELEFSEAVVPHERVLEQAGIREVSDQGWVYDVFVLGRVRVMNVGVQGATVRVLGVEVP